MKITNKLLKSKSPCKEGYIWFLEKYGNKAKVSYETLIKDAPREHRDWIRKNLYPAHIPTIPTNYNGKFKIGDVVYFTLNNDYKFYKKRIVDISDNNYPCKVRYDSKTDDYVEDKTAEFTFDLYTGHGDDSCCWHGIKEKQIFSTLEELRYSWIIKIINMTANREQND